MLRLIFKTATTWLLLVMLLITGTASPALAHTHADWKTPGKHHWGPGKPQPSADAPHQHADHTHHSCAHGHRHEPQQVSHLPSVSRHLHVSWLGLEFTLPVPAKQPTGAEGEDDSQAAVVRLLIDEIPPRSSELADAFQLPLWLPLEPDWDAVVPTRDTFTCIPIPCHPLCDVARHARTGVQLI